MDGVVGILIAPPPELRFMYVTWIIIITTCAVSLIYMNNQEFKNKFMFNAYAIRHRGEWWRFFTGALLHADGMHLLFNMMTFYFFGEAVEAAFNGKDQGINGQLYMQNWPHYELFDHGLGSLMFFLMYVTAIPLASLYSYFKHKDDMYYNALGASGAVSAVLYTFILLAPTAGLRIFFAIPVTGWIYGIIYLLICRVLAKRNVGNIGHDAHFFGSVYGFLFPLIFFPFLAENFVSQIVQSLTR